MLTTITAIGSSRHYASPVAVSVGQGGRRLSDVVAAISFRSASAGTGLGGRLWLDPSSIEYIYTR